MMQVLFWDVDTQIDFMVPGRPLYVQGAEQIRDRLGVLTRYARDSGIRVAGSEDSHSVSDPEIADEPDWVTTYPPHCLAGTEGQRRVPETTPRDPLYIESPALPAAELAGRVESHHGEIYFRKQTFDAFQNPNVEPVLDLLGPSVVVVYGVAQDVCVKGAIEGFLRRGREQVFAVTDATRALDPARGQTLLEEWRARGVKTLTTAEILADAAGGGQRGAA